MLMLPPGSAYPTDGASGRPQRGERRGGGEPRRSPQGRVNSKPRPCSMSMISLSTGVQVRWAVSWPSTTGSASHSAAPASRRAGRWCRPSASPASLARRPPPGLDCRTAPAPTLAAWCTTVAPGRAASARHRSALLRDGGLKATGGPGTHARVAETVFCERYQQKTRRFRSRAARQVLFRCGILSVAGEFGSPEVAGKWSASTLRHRCAPRIGAP
jgi:hypothetical protein